MTEPPLAIIVALSATAWADHVPIAAFVPPETSIPKLKPVDAHIERSNSIISAVIDLPE